MNPPKMVVEKFVIRKHLAFERGEAYIEGKIAQTKQTALDKAKKYYNLDKPDVQEIFDLYCINYFVEYPMDLIGPENYHKIPKNWQEWLDFGDCVYTVTVR